MPYKAGDVVTVIVAWINNDNTLGSKIRPAVIVDTKNGLQVITTATTKNKTGKYKGQWIEKKTPLFIEMGLDEPSFLHLDKNKLIAVSSSHIKRKIGNYKNIEALRKILDIE